MVGLLASALLAATGSLMVSPKAGAAPKSGAKKPARTTEKAKPASPRNAPAPVPEPVAPATPEPAAPSPAQKEPLPEIPPLPPALGTAGAPASAPAATPAPLAADGAVGVPPAKPPVPADDDLFEGTAKPKPVIPVKPVVPNAVPGPPSPGPKFADAWPSEYRAPEADLALAADGEARAQAITEFLRGKLAEERGDADVAIEAWKKAAALDPGDGKLAVEVATELARRNETSEAIRVLKDSIAAAPKEPKTLLYLAQVYAKHLNKVDLAVQTAEKAIEIAPDFFPAYETLYEIVEDQADKKRTAEVLERALKSPSKSAAFWLRLGGFLSKISLDEAGKASPEDLARMEKAYLHAVELKPDDASVLTQAGDYFVVARDPKRSLDFYARATKLNQAPTDPATKGLRSKYIEALIANDRQTEALPLLEELSRDPSSAMDQRLFTRLGELYEQTKQPEKAVELYKRSLVLDVSDATQHVGLAYTQLRAKKPDDAVETMLAAVKKFPDQPRVWLAHARVLTFAKRFADALAAYTKVYDLAKGRDDLLLDETFFFSWGAAAERAGQLELAAEKLGLAIEKSPRSAEYLNYLGYMWVDKGQNLEEAVKLIRQALEIEPANGMYLDSLGWYYFKSGKFEDAKRELLAAVDALKEADPAVCDHLADTYEQLGDHRKAIAFWEKALTLKAEEGEKLQESMRGKIAEAKKKAGE
jgi:tetratricopeptide (TPR) repeat protein